jgi:hypothetical protein
MTAILAPQPTKNTIDPSQPLLCYYTNRSSQLEVARISNIPGWYFERVVFPGQRLMFEAPNTASLEIYTGKGATVMLSDRIACTNLQIAD